MALFGLLIVTIIWGSTFILVKWTVAELDVYYFLFLRFLVATVLLAVFFHRHLKKTRLSTIGAAFILSIFLMSTFASQTEGLRFTTASNSALITGLYLVLIPLFSICFLRNRPQVLPSFGAIISLIGLYFLTQYSLSGFNRGDGITLICSASCAFHILLTGRFTIRHNLIPLVLFQFIFVTIFSGGVAAARMSFTTQISPIAWLTIFITGALATAVAFSIQTAAQRVLDPTRTGIVFAMEAVFGTLFAYLIGGEMLTYISFIGACLMVSGMVIAEIKPVAKYLIDKIAG
jgi:drug/metabolite transporter (DMT)-like permease